MKPPSHNISRSLRSQRAPGREGISPDVSKLRQYSGPGPVPGESGVETAPGAGTANDDRQNRSAMHYADAAGRKVGG